MLEQTYILLSHLARRVYGAPLSYVEKAGFFLVQRIGQETVLQPLDDDSTTLFLESVEKKRKVYFLDSAKDVSLLVRNSVATLSEHNRNTVGTPSLHIPESSEATKKLAEKYNLIDFSEKIDLPQPRQLAKLTYRLILEALAKAQKQKKSKTKIITEYYRPALSAVEEKDFLALEHIKDDVVNYLGMQTRAIESRQIQQAKKTLWKDVKRRLFWLSFGIVAVIFLFVGRLLYRPTANTSAVNQVEVILQPADIENYIEKYEAQNNVKVYPWRRKKIIETLTDAELTQEQINDTLEYYIIQAWKNH